MFGSVGFLWYQQGHFDFDPSEVRPKSDHPKAKLVPFGFFVLLWFA